ncbi:MAG: hypothetical protein ACJA1P_002460, partial [Maribacter sp.]
MGAKTKVVYLKRYKKHFFIWIEYFNLKIGTPSLRLLFVNYVLVYG